MNYLRRHPVAAASTTIGSIFAAALLLIVQPWASKDLNPAYAEVERNVLHVYNLQGETIWNLPVNNIPNGITSEGIHGDYNKHFLRIADLDGDGKNELLLTGNNQTGTFTTDSLYVFNNNGTLRWSQAPPPPVLFGDRTHTLASNWNITDFFTLDQPGEATRLFVTANSNWFPSVLFELDVSSGEILQSYWNAGWIRTREVYPYGEGGRQLILLGVVNNSYQHAALIVLDPDRINGHSPLHESYKPAGIGPADELHYILFKPSHLNRLYSNHLYNYGAGIRLSRDGSLQVAAHENLHKLDRQVSILYTLDQHFTVLEAYGSAVYQRLYSELYEEGELAEPMNEQYWESLKNSVLYWDGEQFVSK